MIYLNNYSLLMPNYSIGESVYEKIEDFCPQYGSKAVIIGGRKAIAAAEKKILPALKTIEIIDTLWYGGEASYENVEYLKNHKSVQECDMIFAVGGGKATDTCKCLGDKIQKPVFTFPTIASNCSCCTSVSIMYRSDGTFIEPYFFLQPPVHAFIDTDIMCHAPEKYIWAGMGDTIAKYYECRVSSRGETLEHFTAFGVQSSGMCVDPIVRWGAQAMLDNKNGVSTYEFQQVVLAITVTTAVVSIFLTRDHTPDYNSGLAHAVFYALTAIKNIEENHLHGEVVAFGLLIMLLCDGQTEEFKRIYDFNRSVGLPVSLDEIEVTRDQIDELLPSVTTLSDVRHYPYEVTVEMLSKALDELEETNRLVQTRKGE